MKLKDILFGLAKSLEEELKVDKCVKNDTP